jgi:tRNA pseudouridine38-40 synthase
MPRYKLLIEYDGRGFAGWQLQADAPTVQGALEAALAKFTGETPVVIGAGRTDAGVHALEQAAHVDIAKAWEPFVLASAINHHLRPHAVSVLSAEIAADDFSARFSAVKRHYVYRILNRRAPPALERGRVWHVATPLDHEAMHAGAQHLLGKHDFTTFRSANCQAQSPSKTLDRLDVARRGEEIEIRAEARSFLHNQVRSMVGSLREVGAGKWMPRDMRKALEAKDRAACGPVAPPDGLYLVRVDYLLPA